jgi:hypothetical protein
MLLSRQMHHPGLGSSNWQAGGQVDAGEGGLAFRVEGQGSVIALRSPDGDADGRRQAGEYHRGIARVEGGKGTGGSLDY